MTHICVTRYIYTSPGLNVLKCCIRYYLWHVHLSDVTWLESKCVTTTSHEKCVSDHWHLDRLFRNFSKLTIITSQVRISNTPVRIILRCPTTKILIKACCLIQPLEQEGGCQKCCISLCSKVLINYFYQMKASPECVNIPIYWTKCWVQRLRRTLRRKV